ncbi:transcriptional regulator [Streptomyces sp. JJ38]|uniref:transcriptional regulator n=1 Tax=Streptomyces sp. JJ38 TaxID=2738128 RepID=UPI001C563137|nr:transcriptional regulator [Streptomyces sp. JJ38]MBW1600464.1 transcriptional regulator [Streptomyces sp. JJ38]
MSGSDDDLEAGLLALQRLLEETVEKHRRRMERDSLITAVGPDSEGVASSVRQLATEVEESVDAVLADTESLDAVQAACEELISARRDVRGRLLCAQGLLNQGLIPRWMLEHPCTDVRVARLPMLQVVIVDSRAALVTTPSTAGRQASVIRAATVIQTFGTLFESLWWHAVPVEDRIEFGDRRQAQTALRILECLLAGVTDEVAARELSVSLRTYRRHVADITSLLGASSRFQAGVRAAELGLLPQSSDRKPGFPPQ